MTALLCFLAGWKRSVGPNLRGQGQWFWGPSEIPPLGASLARRMRPCVRRWVNEWDLRRLYPDVEIQTEDGEEALGPTDTTDENLETAPREDADQSAARVSRRAGPDLKTAIGAHARETPSGNLSPREGLPLPKREKGFFRATILYEHEGTSECASPPCGALPVPRLVACLELLCLSHCEGVHPVSLCENVQEWRWSPQKD